MAIALLYIINNMVAFGQAKQDEFNFTSFQMEKNDKEVVLNWTMNDAEKSNYFEVERSTQGKKFKTIMIVLGPNPSNNEGDNFESIDKISTKNKAYYRLKHINRRGVIIFSPIKSLAFNH